MSMTDDIAPPLSDGFLNTPPRLPGQPGMPPLPGPSGGPPTTTQVSAALASASSPGLPPELDDNHFSEVDLPAGWISPTGLLIKKAQVRELTGYDEERLARLDMQKNVASYVTELLVLGVERLGDDKPSKEVLQSLLIGDRDALVLGIRRATYGDDVEFKLNCSVCGKESAVTIELDKDIPVTELEDPLNRIFIVPLKHGEAKVQLLNGLAQERFSEDMGKKTQAETNTIMLSRSVVEINGVQVRNGEDPVRALSSGDRSKILEFLGEHQPGPQMNEIPVNCATCNEEYPILVGLPSLFRF